MKDSNSKTLNNVKIDFDNEDGIKLIEVAKKETEEDKEWDLLEDVLEPFRNCEGLTISIRLDRSK